MKRAIAPVVATLAMVLAACGGGTDAEPLELSAGGGDQMMSCLAFDPAVLADMPVALGDLVRSVGEVSARSRTRTRPER